MSRTSPAVCRSVSGEPPARNCVEDDLLFPVVVRVQQRVGHQVVRAEAFIADTIRDGDDKKRLAL